jgi:protein tyrosine phosphatase (PTP) superfamily phosphohydrolase (DUF442 family)
MMPCSPGRDNARGVFSRGRRGDILRHHESQGELMGVSDPLLDVLGAIPYAACPVPGLATGGQPSAARWAELARAGYRTVIDLREPYEPRDHDEPAAVRAAGLAYVPLPVSQPRLTDDVFTQFRALVRDPARRPIFVHCATSNRVGALLLPYYALDEHRPLAEAIDLAKRSGLRSPELERLAVEYVHRQQPVAG